MSQAAVLYRREKIMKESNDFLSNLPMKLRYKILESLPLKDAVRTSILSTHWRYEWTKLPQIILDQQFFSSVVEERVEACDISNTYLNIVNHVIFSHAGPLREFVLYVPRSFTNGSAICQWLRFISQKNVSQFTLTQDPYNLDKLPATVFSYAGLTCLTLDNCNFTTLPATFNGFPCLKLLNLCLNEVYPEEVLENFISRCPLLMCLILRTFQIGSVTIHAPKLEYLVVHGFFTKLDLGEETTALKIMCLDFSNENTSLAFGSLPVLQTLHLGPYLFKNCNHRRFNDQCLIDDLRQLETQTLSLIEVYDYGVLRVTMHTDCCCTNFKKGNFPNLKYVQVVDFSSSSSELQFIKSILASAPVLEVITIKFARMENEAKDNLQIAIALLQFPRASKSAQIILKTSHN